MFGMVTPVLSKIISKYNSVNLIIRILIGLFLGVLFALFLPSWSLISVLGTLFVGALKAIAPILVFVLIISSFANSQSTKRGKKRFKTVIILYILSTLLAAITAAIASFVYPVTLKLADVGQSVTPIGGVDDVFVSILTSIVANPVKSLVEANYIGILFWAIVIGLVLKSIAKSTTKDFFIDIADVISKIVKGIINCAPFGIMGLVFQTVQENGLVVFSDYSKLLILLVGSMLFVALVVNPVVVGIFLRKNPYPLVFTCLRESGLTAFFTRSSAANIPVNMNLCEKMGLDKNFYSVCLPLGATINMNGAAITIAIMTLATVNTLGVNVDLFTAIILCLLVTVAACGASGVSGGSLLLIPMACSLFGINNDVSMQVVAIGFIIGVVQDSFETALNSSGDVLFAATAEMHDKHKNN